MTADVDEFLQHYGVPGMEWGKRRAAARDNRALNKISRAKDRADHANDVQAARDRFKSGQARADYKAAKAEYKAQKSVVGSREAKKILNRVKERNLADYEKSQGFKSGKELAASIAVGVAGTILISALAKW